MRKTGTTLEYQRMGTMCLSEYEMLASNFCDYECVKCQLTREFRRRKKSCASIMFFPLGVHILKIPLIFHAQSAPLHVTSYKQG